VEKNPGEQKPIFETMRAKPKRGTGATTPIAVAREGGSSWRQAVAGPVQSRPRAGLPAGRPPPLIPAPVPLPPNPGRFRDARRGRGPRAPSCGASRGGRRAQKLGKRTKRGAGERTPTTSGRRRSTCYQRFRCGHPQTARFPPSRWKLLPRRGPVFLPRVGRGMPWPLSIRWE